MSTSSRRTREALAELRDTIVRRAVLVRVADVPLGRYVEDPA